MIRNTNWQYSELALKLSSNYFQYNKEWDLPICCMFEHVPYRRNRLSRARYKILPLLVTLIIFASRNLQWVVKMYKFCMENTILLTDLVMTGSAGGCGDTSLWLSAGDTSSDTAAVTSLIFFLLEELLLTGDRDRVGDRDFLLLPLGFFCFFNCYNINYVLLWPKNKIWS